MTELMKFCNNCQRSLPDSKFDLHLGYCLRNIKKCADCGQVYDINDEDEHRDQFHSFANCSYCGEQFLAKNLNQHSANCNSKPIACFYCELPIPSEKFEEHRIQCEARTKTCEKCTKAVSNRQYFDHIESCDGVKVESRQYSNSSNDYSEEFVYAHNGVSSYSSPSSYSEPRQVIRTYTRVTTTDPRTGEKTTVIQDDSGPNYQGQSITNYHGQSISQNINSRTVRHPYDANVVRHEPRVIGTRTYIQNNYDMSNNGSNRTSYTEASLPTNTSTYSTSGSTPHSAYAGYDQDPQLQAALLASLQYGLSESSESGFSKK